MYAKKEEINPGYVSKHNSNRKNQVIILMVSNGEKCKWSETLTTHKRVCENKDFCNAIMPSEGIKMLEFNQYEKSD